MQILDTKKVSFSTKKYLCLQFMIFSSSESVLQNVNKTPVVQPLHYEIVALNINFTK